MTTRWALPPWMRSIRLRLTLLYSLVLFSLAAVVVAVIYLGLSVALNDEPVSREYSLRTLRPIGPGIFAVEEQTMREELRTIESVVNERAMQHLRDYSFLALGGLFVASLGVGWVVSGRVLKPIDHITDVAREIQATDLSRRIAMVGPDDELKRLADTFDGMLGRLDAAFEGQRRFIQEASHELRNPLAVAGTNVEVALADREAPPEELRQSLEVVGRSIDRMGRVVDDLLRYSRHERPELRPERVDLASVVHRVGAEFAPSAEAAGLTLTVTPGEQLWVHGDADALAQALSNLLANSIRLTPAGGEIGVVAGGDGDRVFMAVVDDGPGIDVVDHDKVFQRHWSGDGEGSGLGLAIVRQIAEAHGGRVELTSAPGHGASFTVWLPLDGVAPALPSPPSPADVEVPGAR